MLPPKTDGTAKAVPFLVGGRCLDNQYLVEDTPGRFRVRIPVGVGKLSLGTYDLEEARRVRDQALTNSKLETVTNDGWVATGVFSPDDEVSEEDAVKRARESSIRAKMHFAKIRNQNIAFTSDRVCVVALGDQHCGGDGVDYDRMFDEASLIAENKDFYALVMGDVLDNFILPKLRAARAHSRLIITDEWAIVRSYLKLLAPKLLATVQGNHDKWTEILSDIPYFREVMASIAPNALYDSDEILLHMQCGKYDERWKLRHKWRGSSISNATHGIERAAERDQDFDVGIGAHLHTGAVVRQFNCGGMQKLAAMCGSYKRFDPHARSQGFPHPGPFIAPAFIIDGVDGTVEGFADIRKAARKMRTG